MIKKKMTLMLCLMVGCLIAWALNMDSTKAANSGKKKLRVGVYDSRAIRMAYTHSSFNEKFMQKKSREKKEAEEKGDKQKAQALETEMQRYALRAHKQVFSITPVTELLEKVKDKLPEVAGRSGVDMIVNKWQVDYRNPDAQLVDVTLAMVKLFNIKPEKVKSIKALMKAKPMSEADVERHDREHPH